VQNSNHDGVQAAIEKKLWLKPLSVHHSALNKKSHEVQTLDSASF
jgi:hypothetical protein